MVVVLSRLSYDICAQIMMCQARLGLGFVRLRLHKTQAQPCIKGLAWLGLGWARAYAWFPKRKYGNISLKNVSHNMNMVAIWYKNCQALHGNVYQSLVDLS